MTESINNPEQYNRVYIITDHQHDVKYMIKHYELGDHWRTHRDNPLFDIVTLRISPDSFRGHHFLDNDLVILGRHKGPAREVKELYTQMAEYPPADQTPEIKHWEG